MGKSNNSTFVIFIFEISKLRNFEIPKFRPLCIWSFQILTPTRLSFQEIKW